MQVTQEIHENKKLGQTRLVLSVPSTLTEAEMPEHGRRLACDLIDTFSYMFFNQSFKSCLPNSKFVPPLIINAPLFDQYILDFNGTNEELPVEYKENFDEMLIHVHSQLNVKLILESVPGDFWYQGKYSSFIRNFNHHVKDANAW